MPSTGLSPARTSIGSSESATVSRKSRTRALETASNPLPCTCSQSPRGVMTNAPERVCFGSPAQLTSASSRIRPPSDERRALSHPSQPEAVTACRSPSSTTRETSFTSLPATSSTRSVRRSVDGTTQVIPDPGSASIGSQQPTQASGAAFRSRCCACAGAANSEADAARRSNRDVVMVISDSEAEGEPHRRRGAGEVEWLESLEVARESSTC